MKMSEMKTDEAEDLKVVSNDKEDIAKDDHFIDEPQNIVVNVENTVPSHQDEEEIINKKYGGLLAKKQPLLSKDHERAFFDSADWALNKQGLQKSRGPLEALRPKLEPSPHQQLRTRSAYARLDDSDVVLDHNQSNKPDSTEAKNNTSADQSSRKVETEM